MAVAGVLRAFGPAFEASSGVRLEATYLPTAKLLERIRGGAAGDLAILTAEAIDALVAEGALEGRVDLARSFVGVAVRAGAPHPDIARSEALVAALLSARSVAISQSGASGLFMAGLLRRLGIENAMREKTVVLADGFTATLAASGAVELAIQQVSELMVVEGVEIVGRLPAELGGETLFAAAAFRDAASPAAAHALAAALADPDLAPLYARCGLQHAGTVLPKRS